MAPTNQAGSNPRGPSLPMVTLARLEELLMISSWAPRSASCFTAEESNLHCFAGVEEYYALPVVPKQYLQLNNSRDLNYCKTKCVNL